ncbi:MAG: hypothetical protein WBA61_10315 [Aequorivita sp.]
MFTEKSRYKNVTQYGVTDHRGRKVKVVATPTPPQQSIKGYHLLKQGQHTDHLASLYLNDAAAFWRIAEANDCMLPEAIAERSEIAIPNKT